MHRRASAVLLAAVLAAATASPVAAPPAGARSRFAPPTAVEARADVAAYERGAWRYQGRLGDADDASDADGGAPTPARAGIPAGRLLVSLTERPDGTLDGEALLLDPDRRLLAASPIAGHWRASGCRLRLALGDGGGTALDGTCTPSVLAGTLAHRPAPRGPVLDLLEWWGGRTTHGEAWLGAGGDV